MTLATDNTWASARTLPMCSCLAVGIFTVDDGIDQMGPVVSQKFQKVLLLGSFRFPSLESYILIIISISGVVHFSLSLKITLYQSEFG